MCEDKYDHLIKYGLEACKSGTQQEGQEGKIVIKKEMRGLIQLTDKVPKDKNDRGRRQPVKQGVEGGGTAERGKPGGIPRVQTSFGK